MRSTNRHSFIRSLKRKGFKEEIVIKIGLHDLVTSTTLKSNKSQAGNACAARSQHLSLQRFWQRTVPLPQLLQQRRPRRGVVDVVWRLTKAHGVLLVADLPI